MSGLHFSAPPIDQGIYTEASAAPSSPANGDRWLDTDTGIMYTYHSTETVWVEWSAAGAGGGTFTVNTYAYITGSAATFTPAAGAYLWEVWVTGQGGGGGGARASDASSQAAASGGGAGGTAYAMYDATEMGANATYTVGTAAGGGGSNVGGNGADGSDSTFNPAGTGATLTGTGGKLGTGHDNATPAASVRAGGLGGVPTLGDINFSGGDGGAAYTASTAGTTIPLISGEGGASFYGGGGGTVAVVTTLAVAGLAGKAYGSGGSGAACLNSSGGALGGNGAVGCIFIREYVRV